MRIVHVTDTFLPVMGGIETQVSHLATQQAERGHEVFVLTTTMSEPSRGIGFSHYGAKESGKESPESDPRSSTIRFVGGLRIEETGELPYTVIRSQWQNPLGLPIDPHAPSRFKKLIKSLNPDVVHVHLGELTPVAMAVLLGLKESSMATVVSIHSVWSKFPTIPLYRAAFTATGLASAPFLWLANSELTAARTSKVVEPEHVEVHNNSVEAEGWLVPAEPHQGLVVVTATRFAPRKRVPETLRLLRLVGEQLRQNAPSAVVQSVALKAVIAGEGPGLASARSFVEKNGMTGWVELPGRLSREELVDLYSRSDIYLAPSVKDAFSISGLEARASGLAILSRSQSGFGLAVHDGSEGRVVDDDKQMADMLVDWARHPEIVASYKKHNRAVPMPYTWETSMPKLEDAYRRAKQLAEKG